MSEVKQEPPPLVTEVENGSTAGEQGSFHNDPLTSAFEESDDEDMFKSAYETIPAQKTEEGESPPIPQPRSMRPVSLPSNENEVKNNLTPISLHDDGDQGPMTKENNELPKLASVSLSSETARKLQTFHELSDEGENDNEFLIIRISDPTKVGEGMSSYVVYTITTETNISAFKSRRFTVTRRFSDFLGLHEKLVEKHSHWGRIIPPAPEKSVVGTAKMKMSKSEAEQQKLEDQNEFLRRRRASLERFLGRIALHPVLRLDPDFREFLESDTDLPRSTQTATFSVASAAKMFNRFGDSMNRMSFRMDEKDSWYIEKIQQVEQLEITLKKMHSCMESLVHHRKQMASSAGDLSKSLSLLANCEDHTSLSRSLSKLAETEEEINSLYTRVSDTDYFIFSELIKDYLGLLNSIKEAFGQREKAYIRWQQANVNIAKTREHKARAELQGKIDRVEQLNEELRERQEKVQQGEEEFENISNSIKKEMELFEKTRVNDFKNMLIEYLREMVKHEKQLIKYWEAFQPETKIIDAQD